MSRLARPAALLLGTALTFSAIAAHATAVGDDTTGTSTDVTAADVVTALEAAQSATAAAGQGGWRANGLIVNPDKSTSNLNLVYAPQEGRGLIAANNPPFRIIDVDHTGTYESVPSYATTVGGRRRLKRALVMLGHPTATWILARDTVA